MIAARSVWEFSEKLFSIMTGDLWKLKLVGAQMLHLVRALWFRMGFLVKSEKGRDHEAVPASCPIKLCTLRLCSSCCHFKYPQRQTVSCAGYVCSVEAGPLLRMCILIHMG